MYSCREGYLTSDAFFLSFVWLFSFFFFFFFFFQAEDGIRDHCVTGVQKCALPIWRRRRAPPLALLDRRDLKWNFERVRHNRAGGRLVLDLRLLPVELVQPRSEERRVGKECRSRWAGYS